jgi:site-specific recombinase XerD
MLEDFFLMPVAAHRLRDGALGVHLDGFCSQLVELGYRRSTIRHTLWVVSSLTAWMADTRVSVCDLDEHRMEEFLDARRRCSRTWRRLRRSLRLLLEWLRATGVIPAAPICREESSTTTLVTRYEAHLCRERALAKSTVTGYLQVAQDFVTERLDGGKTQPIYLRPSVVHEFLLAQVRRLSAKRAQYVGTALRSFLRFLFVRGQTETDLSLAVPTVRQWRLASVPRHLPTEEVELVLRACDRSTPTGRRDHAVLLLLARLGLRANEIVTLELGDVRWREAEIVVRSKGSVRDRLPLIADVGAALSAYVATDRPTSTSRRLFLCERAPHRGFGHPSTVSTIVARAIDRAGLAPAMRGAHLLRHSLATTMVRRGASFAEIGQVLRHRSANTTEIYAKLDFDALRDVAMAWPTRGGAA